MRLLLATFKHETNTFSPVPTPYQRFLRGLDVPLSGEAALKARRNTGSVMGGFINVAEDNHAEIVLPIIAEAFPSAPVEAEAFERIADVIVSAAASQPFDAILLDLHGAMVATTFDDGEGELLARIRKVQPAIPIGVALDMHTNLYPAMVEHATVITGYHTYPHIDQYQAGHLAAELIMRTLRGEIRPVMRWGNRPMLPAIMRQGTYAGPNRDLQQRCIDLERETVLAASVFTGFPHADIHNAGLSAVICTDGDAALAERHCAELLDEAWKRRAEFVFEGRPLAEAVAAAKQAAGKPTILLDHCDNCVSGGTMDTTEVLNEIIKQGLEDVIFFAIYDPQAVETAIAAGVGKTLTITLGGQSVLASTGDRNDPITLTAQVRTISDGRFRYHGPANTGVEARMGKTVVLDTGTVKVVVISAQIEPNDLNCFYSLGLDPLRTKYIAMKSRVHWRAGFGKVATDVIECDAVGVTTSDFSKLTFEKVRRPIYPFDDI